MKHLVNFCTFKNRMAWFNHNWDTIKKFISNNQLDGLELIIHGGCCRVEDIPEEIIQGIHLCYWPMWLDFWRGDHKELLRQFKSLDNIKSFYGGLEPEVMVDQYKLELSKAVALKADYVVFHVSHVDIEHIYSWEFTYSDWDVLEAAAQLVNQVFGKEDLGVDLLFENLWWPGLTFLNPKLIEKFLEKVQYPRKGFMLDTGHLLITNPEIKNGHEACRYLLEKVNNLGSLKKYIRGIHLNKTLPGSYLKRNFTENQQILMETEDIWERFLLARKHIQHIDQHLIFDHEGVRSFIQAVKPEYLVYEVLTGSLKELEHAIQLQNKVLGRNGCVLT
ncbi:TIM barrel protein [Candidatus Contubernalis alkaliaceticus]|uniref:TIM barrel protein n=1 Tax=Candidatus Contubernalis alkaliaceticus TaxID=338645 RepID=UPI001F4BF3FF|nr:TIM barrel protein [Candidatus Contubernalis alkalaceticus]UNC93067.1 TIM barrel protein [Candidatus Contubernalis alkalaceticus]